MPDHSRARAPATASGPRAPAAAAPSRQDLLGNAGVREVRRAPAQSTGPEGAVLAAARTGASSALPFRSELEASFGADLSEIVAWLGVDLDGIEGAAAASGSEVFFASANPGREQVAEEVAHVLQGHRGQGVSRPGDTSEREAVSAATSAARGEQVDVESGSDGRGVHRDAAPSRSTDVKQVKLAPGGAYTVTAEDMANGEGAAWEKVAEAHGMKVGHLAAFNTHVQTVAEAGGESPQRLSLTLAAGVKLYVPSSAEILYGQCVEKAGGLEAGTALYVNVAKGSNDEVLKAARSRASGEVGESYGVSGVGGLFYTPNLALAGAGPKNSKKVDGRTEYKVNWGTDFWKCSVFINDVAFQAGWKPAITANKHYATAGNVETSGAFKEVSVANARPGHLWQRDGGSGQDQSHNAVLSSFVTVENVDEETDIWKFDIVGSEQDRAAESEQAYTMKKGTNVKTDDKVVRFLSPKAKR